ncbi:fibroblast growth factor receptor 1-like [Planococcus citri]|uniref:fibroblast growth factor receptor 1-like n=1 Tax=Planococcus citri TaxID=170843 RepID=UPI0031FA3747
MTTSRLFCSKSGMVFALEIIIITCSSVICQDTLGISVSIEEKTMDCYDEFVEFCPFTQERSSTKWYRLSVEQLKKIPHNSLEQLHKYQVTEPFFVTGIILDRDMGSTHISLRMRFLTMDDIGMYSCLHWSEKTGIEVIRRIQLRVKCEGDENKNHIKRNEEEIQNARARPYILLMVAHMLTDPDRHNLLLCSMIRGYPEPNNISYIENNKNHPNYFTDDWGNPCMNISKPDSKKLSNYTNIICNTNGCINDTFNNVNFTEKDTAELEILSHQNIYICCYSSSISGNNSRWVLYENGKETIVSESRVDRKRPVCQSVRLAGTYKKERLMDTEWQTICTYHVKIIGNVTTIIPSTTTLNHFSTNQTSTTTENILETRNVKFNSSAIIRNNFSTNQAITTTANIISNDETRNVKFNLSTIIFNNFSTNQATTTTENILGAVPSNYGVSTVKILVTIFIIISLFTMIIGAGFFCKYKREMKKRETEIANMTRLVKKIIVQKQIDIDENSEDILNMPVVSIQHLKSDLITSGMVTNAEYEMAVDERWEYPRQNLHIMHTLGEGEFGKVVQAEASNILEQVSGITIVAVKMLKDNHTDSDMIDLVSEMEVLKLLGNHPNILRLLGCCSQGGPLLVITEFAHNGNLKNFLQKYRHQSTKPTEITLLTYARQIAEGMTYMAAMKCIHRDLAARNILVTADHMMKIGDFGLARNIRSAEYYRKTTQGRLPIKWMAPETLFDDKYSLKSDVWSYGVLLWEIVSFGQNPYPSIKTFAGVIQVLNQNCRLEKPQNTSTDVYNLMLDCWEYEAKRRPNFSTIVERITELLDNIESDYLENSDQFELRSLINTTDSIE